MLQALDRTTLLFRYSLFFFAAHMTAFVGGLPLGVVGVAVAYAISSTVVEPLYCYLTARAVGISVWTFVGGIFGVVQAAVLMAAVVLGVRLGLRKSASVRRCASWPASWWASRSTRSPSAGAPPRCPRRSAPYGRAAAPTRPPSPSRPVAE